MNTNPTTPKPSPTIFCAPRLRSPALGLLFAWFILGCLVFPKNARALNYEMKKTAFSYENCSPVGEGNPCTYTEWDYPVFTDGAPSSSLREINHQIGNILLRREEGLAPAADPKIYSERLFAEYKNFLKKFPDAASLYWYEIKSGEVLLNTPEILSVSLSQESYLGGAHPNRLVTFKVFNPQTGAIYSLLDFFKPESESFLLKKVETAFRKNQDLSATQDLGQAGYFFSDNHFVLPKNFALTPEGVNFFYNTYEVAAYVVGPIDFTLSYKELSSIIPKQGILQKFLQPHSH